MKYTISFMYHYIVFLSMALLITPATFIRPCEKINKIKTEKNKQQQLANENASELLHSEILFRY